MKLANLLFISFLILNIHIHSYGNSKDSLCYKFLDIKWAPDCGIFKTTSALLLLKENSIDTILAFVDCLEFFKPKFKTGDLVTLLSIKFKKDSRWTWGKIPNNWNWKTTFSSDIIHGCYDSLKFEKDHFTVAGLKNKEVYMFLNKIKDATKKVDKTTFCELLEYPIQINLKEKDVNIRNIEECISKYQYINNSKVQESVLNQNFENLFVNYKGVMIGDGEIWFSGICEEKDCKKYRIKIIGINN